MVRCTLLRLFTVVVDGLVGATLELPPSTWGVRWLGASLPGPSTPTPGRWTAPSSPSGSLSPKYRTFASTRGTGFRLLLEHRSVLQHIWQYEEPYLRAPDVHILQRSDSAIPVRDTHDGHLAIHVILRFYEFAPVHFAGDCLAGYYVTLGFVKDFDRDTYGHV